MTMHLNRRGLIRTSLGAALALPYIRRAHAEVSEVTIAKQFGTLYLQQDVMQRQQLVEKQGALLGLPNLRATYPRFIGTGPVTDALLSGSLHLASGGVPGALLLWDRTRGAVKSAFAMNATNQRLLTTNPAIHTIRDLTPADRIALPAAKVSPQAIYLQMAAAKEWGAGEWSRFDAQTIGRGHPDSMAAMLSKTEITCHFSTSPFQERELAQPGVREVMNSYAIQGVNTGTPITVYASSAFRAENPLTWLAVMAAFQEATDWINENPADAAQFYLDNSGDKDTVANVLASMQAPGNAFTLQPRGVMAVANFMADTGVLKCRPERIEEIFFPESLEPTGT